MVVSGPGVEELAVRQDEHERVERHPARGLRQVGPRVRLRVVDRGQRVRRVGERDAHARLLERDAVARDHEHAAVRQRGRRRVPARDAHVGAACPRARLRVVEVRVLDALVGLLVAAERPRSRPSPSVTWPAQKRLRPVGIAANVSVDGFQSRSESRAASKPSQAATWPVGGEREVHGHDRPGLRRGEAADHVGARVGGRLRRARHHRLAHVAGDLRRGQRAVVDPDLVDEPVEVLAPDVVGAEGERAALAVAERVRQRPRAHLRCRSRTACSVVPS